VKVSEVSKDDCMKAAQLINMLQIAKYEIGGKDMCAGADSIRWLQELATGMAKGYQSEAQETAAPKAPEGLAVKSYSPGKGR
jgi:hypothetical protein